jgi:hypothetical protein
MLTQPWLLVMEAVLQSVGTRLCVYYVPRRLGNLGITCDRLKYAWTGQHAALICLSISEEATGYRLVNHADRQGKRAVCAHSQDPRLLFPLALPED